jgi:hypothetical protein
MNAPIDQVPNLLHKARELLLDAKARGVRKRPLRKIEQAVTAESKAICSSSIGIGTVMLGLFRAALEPSRLCPRLIMAC